MAGAAVARNADGHVLWARALEGVTSSALLTEAKATRWGTVQALED